jgi:hypothetical protein
MKDETFEAIERKQRQWLSLVQSPEYRQANLVSDAWCASFVWPKHETAPVAPTDDLFKLIASDADRIPSSTIGEVEEISRRFVFFHWHLAFPDVFAEGGFHCVLGNPPWERVKLQEKEWFAERSPEIATASNAAERKRLIEKLTSSDPVLYRQYLDDLRKADGESHVLRNSGLYPLCGRGDINLYAVFAERMRNLLRRDGLLGCVVPTGIATDDTTKFFFQNLVDKKSLVSLFDFENKGIFPAVDSRMKFCLLTTGSGLQPSADEAEFVFFAHSVNEVREPGRVFSMTAEDIRLLNPDTATCPAFRSRDDARLTIAAYRHVPVLGRTEESTADRWHLRIPQGLFHQTNDAGLLMEASELEKSGYSQDAVGAYRKGQDIWNPMYEGRMIHIFNHRASSVSISETNAFRSGVSVDVTKEDLADPAFFATPRYWASREETERRIPEEYDAGWFVGFKDVTSATNERTMIAAVIPRTAVVYSIRVIFALGHRSEEICGLVANLNSFCFDFMARGKTPGNHITDYIVRQLPVLAPGTYSAATNWLGDSVCLADWLVPRILELSFTSTNLKPFAVDCGWNGAPFLWDEERRLRLLCELDAAFFHLYFPSSRAGAWVTSDTDNRNEVAQSFATPRQAVEFVMETFPIVRKRDLARYGDYRTKLMILDIYDEMQRAIQSGDPYRSSLSIPPADPRLTHANAR